MKLLSVIGLVSLIITVFTDAADYYISPQGSDTNPGTLEAPRRTIKKGSELLKKSDTLHIRAGRYHEEVMVSHLKGTADKGFTIKAYDNEKVIIDGTYEVTTPWTLHEGNIYKTVVNKNVWQVWVDEQPMTLARFPNVQAWSPQMWSKSSMMAKGGETSKKNRRITDGKLKAISDASLVGCMAVINMETGFTRKITAHTPGNNYFMYESNKGDSNKKYTPKYFIEGGVGAAELALLDTPGEWAFDEITSTLYLWMPDGESPEGHTIKCKNHTYAFRGNPQYLTIDGLDFFATSFRLHQSKHVTIQNCNFLYPSFSKRSAGKYGVDSTSIGWTRNFLLYNCDFKFMDGMGLHAEYAKFPTIINNSFYMVDYSCLGASNSITLTSCEGVVYNNNTLHTTGSGNGLKITVGNAVVHHTQIKENYFAHLGLLHTAGDGAGIQYSPGNNPKHSINAYNWFMHNTRYSLRFDGDPGGNGANIFRNVSWTPLKQAFRIKGDFHEVYNNTVFSPSGYLDIAQGKGGNNSTITRNNLADQLRPDHPGIPGTDDHNYDALDEARDLQELLRDPANYDFRPRADSVIIDRGLALSTAEGIDVSQDYHGNAPDLGAYEHGNTNYLIPGRKLAAASHPVPPEGTKTAQIDADLMWREALYADSYDVYFGNSPENLEFKINQPNNIFTPSQNLEYGVTYYWRVDSIVKGEIIPGAIWSFKVKDLNEVGVIINWVGNGDDTDLANPDNWDTIPSLTRGWKAGTIGNPTAQYYWEGRWEHDEHGHINLEDHGNKEHRITHNEYPWKVGNLNLLGDTWLDVYNSRGPFKFNGERWDGRRNRQVLNIEDNAKLDVSHKLYLTRNTVNIRDNGSILATYLYMYRGNQVNQYGGDVKASYCRFYEGSTYQLHAGTYTTNSSPPFYSTDYSPNGGFINFPSSSSGKFTILQENFDFHSLLTRGNIRVNEKFTNIDSFEVDHSIAGQTTLSLAKGNQIEISLYECIVHEGSGTGSYVENSHVTIEAEPEPGYVFDQWIGDIEFLTDTSERIATVIMPKKEVSFTALYKELESFDPNEHLITLDRKADGNITLQFNGKANFSYRIEYSSDLINWTPLDIPIPIVDDPQLIIVLDEGSGNIVPPSSEPQRFYRLVDQSNR